MASSNTILTPRLRLEPFVREHLTDRYVSWLNDPLTMQFSEQRLREHTIQTCREYWESFSNSSNYFWAIVVQGHGLGHVGNMNAYVDEHNSVADVGILIGEARARGCGLAAEAWLGACDWLLRACGVRKVTAGTLAINKPMVALMKRTGMVDDGRRIRQCLWNGTAADLIHAAFHRDDWLARFPNGPFTSLRKSSPVA